MPYIQQDQRLCLDPGIENLTGALGTLGWPPGAVNYVVTRIVLGWWSRNPKYETGNAILGVLAAVGAEFVRRRLAPYEDAKIDENGDITE